MRLFIVSTILIVITLFGVQQIAIMTLCTHTKTDNGFTYYCENVR